MSTDKDSDDRILPYIINDLGRDELSKFEEQLKVDSTLRKEVALSHQIKLAVNDESLNEFDEKLKAVSDQYHKGRTTHLSTKRLTFSRTWLALAASVLVVIVCFTWIFLEKTPLNAEALYAQYAKHDFSFTERGPENQLIIAEEFLENEEYKNALPLLKDYLVEDPKAADVILAHGIANMEVGNFSQAISIFSQLKRDHPIFINESLWYIALTHLKTGELTQSIASLSSIETISGRYDKAQKLIDQIQSLEK